MDEKTQIKIQPAGTIGILRIGDVAPDFRARSTQGEIVLSDYRGEWVILASHPGDFTPVCTSEFIGLANNIDAFEKRNCAVIALSVDSLHAHLAWVKSIYDHQQVKIEFPIVEDPTMAIANAYGMTSSNAADAATVRATFFIDPAGMIRASTYYPATIGRSVSEMIRMLSALQESDKHGNLTPEGWIEGETLLSPAPQDTHNLFDENGGSWYYQHPKGGGTNG